MSEQERIKTIVEAKLLRSRNKIISFEWTSPYSYTVVVGPPDTEVTEGLSKENES